MDGFPANEIEFRYVSPVQDIEYIKYTDAHGEETEIAETDYILDNISFVNKIVPATNKRWPCVRLKPINGIKIRFVAGYENEEDVPQSVKWAMILQMKLLYEDYKPEQRKALETARDNLLGTKRVVPA